MEPPLSVTKSAWHAGLRTAVAAVSLVLCAFGVVAVEPARAQHTSRPVTEQPLEAALRALQRRGLPLVFSSQIVTPDMRVRIRPRSGPLPDQLAELLAPHGLEGERGPGGVWQVVRRRRSTAEPDEPRGPKPSPPAIMAATTADGPTPGAYFEQVTVTGERHPVGARAARADRLLTATELTDAAHLVDDPVRALHTLPGVSATDDYRNEISVGGSLYRHTGVVIDGVAAPWLQHASPGRGDTATMSMLRGELLESAALLVGAYPRHQSGQIGPQLDLWLREGSRARTRAEVGVSSSHATLTAEGPIGLSGRGSWVLGLRRSYVEWPVGRDDHASTVFGFTDTQSKFVYDVRPGQQVSASVIAGLSAIERDTWDGTVALDGRNASALAVVTWRSVLGPRTLATQRGSWTSRGFSNRDRWHRVWSDGADAAAAYAAELLHSRQTGSVEASLQVRRVSGARARPRAVEASPTAPSLARTDATWLERSLALTVRRALRARVSLAAGARVADSSLTADRAVDRWARAEWRVSARSRLHGSVGVAHQFPDADHVPVAGTAIVAALRPERAAHVDLGLSYHATPSVRVGVTTFARREHDILQEPDPATWLDGASERFDAHFVANAWRGLARGIELSVTRRAGRGISGSFGYVYGRAEYRDDVLGQTFASDRDERHSVTAHLGTTLPWRLRVASTFRAGTNVPLAGRFEWRDGTLFSGGSRNAIRLPAYARLDLRGERTLDWAGRRLAVIVEAINVLDRANLGPADGVVVPGTGQAIGFTERLFPRLLSAGFRVAF